MPDSTLIRLDGRDALDLLHRVTTQSLLDLPAGSSRMTLACDFRGRLLHRFAVAHTTDGGVWLLRDDAPAAALIAFLDKQIFREDVRIADESERAVAALRVGDDPVLAADTGAEGIPSRVRPDARFEFTLGSVNPTAPDTRERERIRAALPRQGYEVHEDWNPYEIGLAAEMHFEKGCYTGQEALLRMSTYGGVRRRLVRLEGDGAAPELRAAITVAGEAAGVVTSAVADGAGWIGLGVMRREALESAAGTADVAERPVHVHAIEESRPQGLPAPR